MVSSGNYLMGVEYGTDRVEFTFRYDDAAANMTGETPAITSRVSNTTTTASPAIANDNNNTATSLSDIKGQLQDLFGGGN